MGERLRKRTRSMATVMLVAAAAMLTQGCVLERKEIIDVYKFVQGVPVGVSFEIARMTFPYDYCIDPGKVRANALFTPAIVGLTALVLTVATLDTLGLEVDRRSFTLRPRNGRYRGSLSISEQICINAGYTLVWRVKPRGADIPFLAALASAFIYLADPPLPTAPHS